MVENNEVKSEKNLDLEEIIEKGKQGKLSSGEVEAAVEEMDFDSESLDKLYDSMENSGIGFPGELSNHELNEIESEV